MESPHSSEEETLDITITVVNMGHRVPSEGTHVMQGKCDIWLMIWTGNMRLKMIGLILKMGITITSVNTMTVM